AAARSEKEGCGAGGFVVEGYWGPLRAAPALFGKEGWTVDPIPADRLMRSAVVVDVTDKAKQNADYRVTVADIQAVEARTKAPLNGAVVLIATGWDRFWPDRARYMGAAAGV